MNRSLTKSSTPVFTYALTRRPLTRARTTSAASTPSVTQLDATGRSNLDIRAGTDYTEGVAAESVPSFAEQVQMDGAVHVHHRDDQSPGR